MYNFLRVVGVCFRSEEIHSLSRLVWTGLGIGRIETEFESSPSFPNREADGYTKDALNINFTGKKKYKGKYNRVDLFVSIVPCMS